MLDLVTTYVCALVVCALHGDVQSMTFLIIMYIIGYVSIATQCASSTTSATGTQEAEASPSIGDLTAETQG